MYTETALQRPESQIRCTRSSPCFYTLPKNLLFRIGDGRRKESLSTEPTEPTMLPSSTPPVSPKYATESDIVARLFQERTD